MMSLVVFLVLGAILSERTGLSGFVVFLIAASAATREPHLEGHHRHDHFHVLDV